MASFTDIIPQFNPYVQQLPVEAMVQVGMEKQRRYDEGIQKIQSQIDTIGGMDIYSTKHKAYLQSKLNELGNNLSMVAAGDFSNFQLVNSVGGMIGQVVKDPVVKNAYESTQLIRKQQANMEEAKKNGKSAPENEVWFTDQINRWDNDPDLLKKFTGEYIPYTDVGKKLTDIASKIKDMERSIDIPYQRNADGSYRLDRNGNPMVDDAMLRIKVKGTPAEKILNTFYSTLDENDKRQLMITGNYHYRGATKATFQNDIINTYSVQKKALVDNLSEMAVQLKTNDQLTSSQRAQMEAAINNGVAKLNDGYFEKSATAEIDKIDKVSNMEDFKYRIYTQKYLTGLAQDLSNQSYTEEYLSNPYKQMQMEQKKLELQRNKYIQEHQEFLMDYGLKKEELEFSKYKWKTEQDEKAAEKAALAPKTSYGGLGTDVPPPTLGDLEKVIKDTKTTIDSLKASAGRELFSNLDGTRAQQKAVEKLIADYITNPTSITDNDERAFVEEIRGLQLKIASRLNLAEQAYDIDYETKAELKNLIGGMGGVNDANGRTLYTAADLNIAYTKLQKFRTITPSYGPARPGEVRLPTLSTDSQAYLNSLPENLKPLGRILVKYNEGDKLTPTEKIIGERAQEVYMKFGSDATSIISKGEKKISDFLSTHMPEVQVTYGTLNMDDKVTAKNVEYLIGNATRFHDEFGYLDQENREDFNPSTVSAMRTGDGAKETRYIAERNNDGTGRLVMYDKDNNKQVIPLSQSDLVTYFPDVAKTNFMTDVKFDIMSSKARTTNIIGRENPIGARYSGYTIPGIAYTEYAPRVRVDIEGKKGNRGDEYDLFQVRLYAFDGNIWKDDVLNQQGHVGAAGVEAILKEIGPGTVEEVLRKK